MIATIEEAQRMEALGEVELVKYLVRCDDLSALKGMSKHIDYFIQYREDPEDCTDELLATNVGFSFAEYASLFYSESTFGGTCEEMEGINQLRLNLVQLMESSPTHRYWFSFDQLVNIIFHDVDDDWNDEFMSLLGSEPVALARLLKSMHNYVHVPESKCIHDAFQNCIAESFNKALKQLRKYYPDNEVVKAMTEFPNTA